MQEDSLAAVDTLTQTYSDKWSGAAGGEEVGAFVQFMSSNDLIFVVLGVSLIIWAVLLFFLIRVDKKVSELEDQIKSS
ncbi:MAG: CcmD family protein [Balneolaceae bacterium]